MPLKTNPLRAAAAIRQRGLSLVELLVGIAVGMFVVAAAATLVSTQLVDNRRLLLETQVQQDLRAAADIIARDLRRAGTIEGEPFRAARFVWRHGDPAPAPPNPSVPLTPGLNNASVSQVDYFSGRYQGTIGPYGFQLQPGSTVIEANYVGPAGGWQPLTDPTTMRVTRFAVTAVNQPPVQLVCPRLCPGPDPRACWPSVIARSLRVEIDAEAVDFPTIQRRVDEIVHLRSDAVRYNGALPSAACPP